MEVKTALLVEIEKNIIREIMDLTHRLNNRNKVIRYFICANIRFRLKLLKDMVLVRISRKLR